MKTPPPRAFPSRCWRYMRVVGAGVRPRRSVVREHVVADHDPLGDAAEDEARHEVVLDLGESTDGADENQVSHVHDRGTAPREVAPRVVAVLVDRVDDVAEVVLAALEPDVEGAGPLELVLVEPQQRPHLADCIGDVALPLVAPSTDEPDELVGVIPDLVEVGDVADARGGHGEAEALGELDETAGLQPHDALVVVVEQLAQVDVGVVFALVDLVEGHAGHVQQDR